jgi:hypothetical protein
MDIIQILMKVAEFGVLVLIASAIYIVNSTEDKENCSTCGEKLKYWDTERMRHPYCPNHHKVKTLRGYLAQ